jgi:copper chaperone CopZ
MKKIFVLTLVLFASLMGSAQVAKPTKTAIIKTPNALCEQCKLRIEGYLKRYDGVLESVVNYRKGETKVKFVIDRINIEEIKTAIANIGYDADDVTAEETAYNRLPKTCKKFEEGGGHPKPKATPAPPPPAQ